ncbi:hypothetical protein C2G38_2200226 [Gigaspora rosea]|uniref:Uncharacterized protein n=1 Tax=Gigaspora rosea TaxID=44941 RepID=A0A397UZF9_9GLOM|nr:hypothetical protein C2G38_2200226 [Gigaspora rosea]
MEIIEPIKSISEMLSSIEELNKLRSTLGIKPVHNPFERIKDSLVLKNINVKTLILKPETNLIILQESIQNEIIDGTPMLILLVSFDQLSNSEKLVGLGVALTLPNYFSTNHTKLLVRINSKRKHRAADLIKFVLHASSLIPLDNTVDDDDDYDDYRIIEMSGDYKGLLKEWITPDVRMGFLKECI